MNCLITVLGGGISKMTVSRVIEAVKLAKRIKCGLMLVGADEEVLFMYRIINLMCPNQEVILVGGSRNTFDNAYYANLALSKLGFNGTLILVTSKFHAWRAYWLFTHMVKGGELSLVTVNDGPEARIAVKEKLSRLLAIFSIALLRMVGIRAAMMINGLYESLKPW
ncbi:YdcF family protein [Caldivirga sp.]|uniref:YdcF family protein n=1 Tax=Caldivirga sp. TaxID=2080243 RepID=UPI003D130D3C